MKVPRFNCLFLFTILLMLASCKKGPSTGPPGTIQLDEVKVGTQTLSLNATNFNIPVNGVFVIHFNDPLDTTSARNSVYIEDSENNRIPAQVSFPGDSRTIKLTPADSLRFLTTYRLQITSGIKGAHGQTFPGITYSFITENGKLLLVSITLNQQNFRFPPPLRNISFKNVTFEIRFSLPLDSQNYKSAFVLSGNVPLSCSISDSNKTVTVTNITDLSDVTRYFLNITSNLKAGNGYTFDGFINSFYTQLDSVPKFPLITDDELLTLVQQQTFRYFYDNADPASGMAKERKTSGTVVTTGGSGFGVMALVVGMQRGFITRSQGLARMNKILTFLETCDRFHGAWPHWLDGNTGHVIPFGTQDDGADLVETSYMVQGLLTIRQYMDPGISEEKTIIDRINALTDAVEYDWFTRGQNVLYWHWSPDYGWAMNVRIQGYNETLITYVVASTSTTHPISAAVYHEGYARNGGIVNGNTYYGYMLPLGEAYGGPLFFTQYSFLGLDPRNLQDQYANYWEQNVNQSLINWSWCVDNPHNWVGYSTAFWGLTACDNPWGYNAHSPTNDLGVIGPTAAVSALPYTPVQSMAAIRGFYYYLGNRLWGEYGFYDAFDETEGWWANSYLAIDQGPMVGMIENYRTGLLWNLFMSCPEVQSGLTKLGFTY